MSNLSAKELLAQADQLMRRTRPADDLPVLTELVRDTELQPPMLEERIDNEDAIFSFEDMALPEADALDLTEAMALLPALTQAAPAAPAEPDYAPPQAAPTPPISAYFAPSQPTVAMSSWTASPISTPTGELATSAAVHSQTEPTFRDLSASTSIASPIITSSESSPTQVLASTAPPTALYSREQFDAMLVTKLEEIQHSVYSQVMQQLELHATGRMRENLRASLEPTLKLIVDEIAAQVVDETAIQMQSVISNSVDAEVARLREQLTKRRDHR
jgi:hypothetical protein